MSKATRFLFVLTLCTTFFGLSRAQEPVKTIPAQPESPQQCGEVVAGLFSGTTQGITLPTVVPASKVAPNYPEAARKSGVQGKVHLSALVCKDGTVQGVEVLKTPSPELAQAAVEAVFSWKFNPAVKNGKPVAVRYTVSVEVKPEAKP